MNLTDKIAHATAFIRHFPGPFAALSSFGKDSMVLLHLIKQVMPKDELGAHDYPVPVIWYKHHWFPSKHEFANGVIRSWSIPIVEYLPFETGVKCKEDGLELVSRYNFGSDTIVLPMNTEEPMKRRDFVCGVQWLLRPKQTGMTWLWKTVFHGHKSSDIDPYEGHVPLSHDAEDAGGVNLVFPLRHWTDDDVWEYIEKNNVPFDKRRYAGRLEVPDKWLNPDYLHACTKCIDPRETAKQVHCPKLGKMIDVMGDRVNRLDELPPYIRKQEEVAA